MIADANVLAAVEARASTALEVLRFVGDVSHRVPDLGPGHSGTRRAQTRLTTHEARRRHTEADGARGGPRAVPVRDGGRP